MKLIEQTIMNRPTYHYDRDFCNPNKTIMMNYTVMHIPNK